ncbi:proline iminopeptidase [Actibacterium atlanticum]|uniref:Proline iminopeptidase n=1 Tax=Actibacterium atlanticum TaxID=1461693 RepID=A0A058ZNU0_9RHOB|nr:prolyl aminopeptidase [Actibacterium atlanticum]KCV82496.1 proline iminopeptidase [Actibacterium atlanticum]
MDKSAGQKSAAQMLYPPLEPYDQRMVDVGDGHTLYVEQCGHPDGIPVVVVHGGPGGGCSPAMRRYFDPSEYRIILFDQRGCGRSRPHASVDDNTTWHLVADMEHIRNLLEIDRWVVFGGSWGATLSLVYAQTHPEHVAYLVLRGVFLMTQGELDWFYRGGVGQFWPDLWTRFEGMIPEDERGDMVDAYHKRLFSGDRALEIRYAKAWTAWENALASIDNEGFMGDAPAEYARAFARLENHYFHNGGWLAPDQQILSNVSAITHIPATIVQGRYDMVCPPRAAWALAENWGRAELSMVPLAGHALSEPGITAQLLRTTRAVQRQAGMLGF